ncbi:Os03g0106850, partial [Oryza sativa Japonica Group]
PAPAPASGTPHLLLPFLLPSPVAPRPPFASAAAALHSARRIGPGPAPAPAPAAPTPAPPLPPLQSTRAAASICVRRRRPQSAPHRVLLRRRTPAAPS